MAISKKISERIVTQLKKYQAVLAEAINRDISESDTVVIVADMIADILGYKKYIEITTEFAVRGTYVDLAVKIGSDVRFFIEVKAVGTSLKPAFVKQAIDYGANHGVEWVILTNGIVWQVYKIHFRQPVDKSLVYEIDMLNVSTRSPQVLECLGNLSREGFTRSSMTAFYQQQQAMSKFSLGAILLSNTVLQSIKRELKRAAPTIKIDDDYLSQILKNDVIKREVVDSDEAKQAVEFLKKSLRVSAKAKEKTKKAVAQQEKTVIAS